MVRVTAEEDAIPNDWRTRKPGSIICIIIGIFRLLLRGFCYGLYFIPKSTRPSRQWTYRQALTTQLMKDCFGIITDIGLTQSLIRETWEIVG
jgi:hypothetical protein